MLFRPGCGGGDFLRDCPIGGFDSRKPLLSPSHHRRKSASHRFGSACHSGRPQFPHLIVLCLSSQFVFKKRSEAKIGACHRNVAPEGAGAEPGALRHGVGKLERFKFPRPQFLRL